MEITQELDGSGDTKNITIEGYATVDATSGKTVAQKVMEAPALVVAILAVQITLSFREMPM